MAGNNSVVGLETITFTDNMSFDGTERGGAMTTNGQLWIGSTAPRHVKLGTITSPSGTITIGYSSPNITLDITGGSVAVEQVTVDGGQTIVPSGTPENITLTGNTVANATHAKSVFINKNGASSASVDVQVATAIASTDITKTGIAAFNSSQFTVDTNGFVTVNNGGFTWNDVSGAFSPLKNNGYFVTGTATGTLPASPSQGDTIKFLVDHASQVLTIQANTGQRIRIGSIQSSAAGTAVSTLQGDSVDITYRASDTTWMAIGGSQGTWTLA